MKPFSKINSIITPFDKANVDTDQIIPKQFLKLITKSGFGKFLFYDWRFNHDGKKKEVWKADMDGIVDVKNKGIKKAISDALAGDVF